MRGQKERQGERQRGGIANDTVEVPLRIYLPKFQGRRNMKAAFSLRNFTSFINQTTRRPL